MSRPGDLVDALTHPAETIRALEERSRWLERIGWPADPDGLRALRQAVEDGSFTGAIWIGPKDEAAGLVRYVPSGPLARDARPFLMPGYRSIGALRAFVDRIERSEGLPIAVYRVEGTDLAPREIAGVLEPLTFRRVERFDMQFPAEIPVPEERPQIPGLRNVRAEDEAELAALLQDAYSDFPLDPAYFGDRPDLAGSLAAVHQLFDGTYGASVPEASYVVERDGRLVGAVLVNEFQGPLIAEVMVARDHRRQGLASALLRASVRSLRERSTIPPRLVVTAVNERARRLYTAFGFRIVPLPMDSVWLSLERRGLPELVRWLPALAQAPVARPGVATSRPPNVLSEPGAARPT